MRMHYDKESDALFIELYEASPVDSFDYEEGVTGILDADGRIIALEILDLHDRLDDTELLAEIDAAEIGERQEA